jgi:predicted Rossmann-fold nucleotide-binding protein
MPLFHHMIAKSMISATDLKYVLFTDSQEEALQHIKQFALTKYEERRKRSFHRSVALGE